MLDIVLADRLRSSGAVLLEGAKACGKTSTAEQVANNGVFLDRDPAALEAIRIDPSIVLNGAPPMLVDEWQLEATRVWNYVRGEVDRRAVPGQFVLTGSATPQDDERRHSGAGRFSRIVMRPMSLYESGHSTGSISLAALMAGERPTATSTLTVPNVVDLVVSGGWPANLTRDVAAAARANVDYLRTITEVDIPRIDDARKNPVLAWRLCQALARNVAMEEVITRIAAEVESGSGNVARSTVYAYMSALERLMVVEPQPPWATHLRSRARLKDKSRTHFVDPSLAVAALSAGPNRLLKDLNYFGYLFESLVVRDCRIYSTPLDGTIYHYRDSNELEVDVIIETLSGRWGAFEVKLGGEDAIEDAAKSVLKFASKVDTEKVGEPGVLGVITAGRFGYTRPDGVVVVPIGALGP